LNKDKTGRCNQAFGVLLVGVALLTTVASGLSAAPPANPADQSFTALKAAVASKKFIPARALAQEFVTKFGSDPRVPDALFLKGLAELRAGDENTARGTWNWLFLSFPKADAAARALEQLFEIYGQQQQLAQQKDCQRRLLRDFPAHPITVRLHTQQAQVRFLALDYAGAVASYQSVAKHLPVTEQEKLKFAQAMVAAKNADPKSLVAQANQLLEQNEIPVAIQVYEEVLRRQPSLALTLEAKTKLGWCHAVQNQFEKAEQLWQAVIREGPATDPWVGESQWHMIRLLAGPQRKWEAAAKLCETVAQNFPKQARGQQALFTRAWLYWAHQKWQPARAAFDDLLQAYPSVAQHPPIQNYIEQCENNLGKGKAG